MKLSKSINSPFPKGSTPEAGGISSSFPKGRGPRAVRDFGILKSSVAGRPPSFSKGGIKPKAIVLSGYGLNCESETAFAFARVGASADIVHINDIIAKKIKLTDYQIMALPGGFSYGDDTGSGKAYANKLKNHLAEDLQKFAQSNKLIIGICNGFQILTNTGLLPGALLANDNARYTVRWVDVRVKGSSPWLAGLTELSLPIAHGEGKYYSKKKVEIALQYVRGEMCQHFNLPANPNGAQENIAGVTSYHGRVLGLMPHPERAQFFTQLPHWTLLRETLRRASPRKPLPVDGLGLQIFKNAVNYFRV